MVGKTKEMLKEMGASCCFLQLQDATNNKDLSYNRRRILDHGSYRVLNFLSSGNWKALSFAEDRSCTKRQAKKVLILDLDFRPCSKGCLCISHKHEM